MYVFEMRVIDEREKPTLAFIWTTFHFTVVYLVTWPMTESEAGVGLVVVETSMLFLCKFLLISMTTTSLT